MSRTFRRKGYESTMRRWEGSKHNGYYTEYSDWNWRAMTEEEKNKEYWRIHGESKHHNAWSPSRWYRKKYTPRRKHWNRMEMIRYLNDPQNYDPQFLAKDQNCWWDWC